MSPELLRAVGNVALHRSIATRIRYSIADGTFLPGERLPSLRHLAAEWNVCIHTVRRAYLALEGEGIIRTTRAGSTVAGATNGAPAQGDLSAFSRWAARTAAERFGVSPAGLADAIVSTSTTTETLYTAECSSSLAHWLARQVRATWAVDSRGVTIDRIDAIDRGLIVGTYYHYDEVRLRVGGAVQTVFLPVQVDPAVVRLLEAGATRGLTHATFCGVDAASLQAMAHDLRRRLGTALLIDLVVCSNAASIVRRASATRMTILSPQHWDRLTAVERRRPNVLPYLSRFTPAALDSLARARGWVARTA